MKSNSSRDSISIKIIGILLLVVGAFIPFVADSVWKNPNWVNGAYVIGLAAILGLLLYWEQQIQSRYENAFHRYKDLAASLQCRLLYAETDLLYKLAKKALPQGDIVVRSFFYAIRNETFVPIAFWKEDGETKFAAGCGDVDARTKFSFADAEASKLVIWDAYVNEQAVKNIVLEDTVFYTDELKKRIDIKIKTVLARVIKDKKGGKPVGLISFSCNYDMATVWNNDASWDAVAQLTDQVHDVLGQLLEI